VRAAGLDLSISSTGFTIIEGLGQGAPMFRVNRVRSVKATLPGVPQTLLDKHERFSLVERQLANIYWHSSYLGPIDMLAIEAPSYDSNDQYANDLAELRGRVLKMLLKWGTPTAEVAPPTLKKYATGSGATRGVKKVQKADVVRAARDNYPREVAQQIDGHDTADSLILAAMAARYLGHTVEERALGAANLATFHDIRWPERIPTL
jgi:crossover junction endodeoxyribonuclease RuvC